jgi:phage baseplate assembly protein W
MLTLTVPVYSDVNLYAGRTSSADLVFDEDSINQSILTILATPKGTRLFHPDFGSQLEALLFEPMDDGTAASISHFIIEAIEQWEKRITISNVEVVPDYINQQYYVAITYRVPTLENRLSEFAFNLVQNRG